MDATITLKATPWEFDLIRHAIRTAIEVEKELQQNIKDENTDKKSIVRVAGNKDYQASLRRQASFALLLTKLQGED